MRRVHPRVPPDPGRGAGCRPRHAASPRWQRRWARVCPAPEGRASTRCPPARPPTRWAVLAFLGGEAHALACLGLWVERALDGLRDSTPPLECNMELCATA